MSGMQVARGLAGFGVMLGVSGAVSSATQSAMNGGGPSPSRFDVALAGGSLLALTILSPGLSFGRTALTNAAIGGVLGLGSGLLFGSVFHKDAHKGAIAVQSPVAGHDAGSTSGNGPLPIEPGAGTDHPADPTDLPPKPDTLPDGTAPGAPGTIDGGEQFPVNGGPAEAPPTPDTLPDGSDGHVPVDPPPVGGRPWHPGGTPADPTDLPPTPGATPPATGGGWIDPGFTYVPPNGTWNTDPGFYAQPTPGWNGDPGMAVPLSDRFTAAAQGG